MGNQGAAGACIFSRPLIRPALTGQEDGGIMKKRIIVRLELSQTAKKALEETCERNGMTQVAVSSRLVEWFHQQSDMLQAAILGHYPKELESDIAKLILQRMSNG
jgi:hypothetical protein